MAESLVVKNARDGTLTITNGTRSYTVSVEQGNFAASGMNHGNYEKTVIEDRGEFQGLRRTKRKYIPLTFTAYMRDLVDGTDPTLVGMLLRKGVHASEVSTLGANAEVYTVDILHSIDGTTHGDAANHTITYEDCDVDSVDFAEAEDKNLLTINLMCYGTITLT